MRSIHWRPANTRRCRPGSLSGTTVEVIVSTISGVQDAPHVRCHLLGRWKLLGRGIFWEYLESLLLAWQVFSMTAVNFLPCLPFLLLDSRRTSGVAGCQDGGVVQGVRGGGRLERGRGR